MVNSWLMVSVFLLQVQRLGQLIKVINGRIAEKFRDTVVCSKVPKIFDDVKVKD